MTGWDSINRESLVIFRRFAFNPLRNFQYVIRTPHCQIVVDAILPAETLPLLAQAPALPVVLLLTHTHHDHIAGLADFMKVPGIRIFAHPQAEPGFPFQNVLDKQQTGMLLPDWIVLPAPGHHFHHVVAWHSGEKILISGDLLFSAGPGNARNAGDPQLLLQTCKELYNYPPETVFLAGHDYRVKNLEFASLQPETAAIAAQALADARVEQKRNGYCRDFFSLARDFPVNPYGHALRENSPAGDARFLELRRMRDSF